MIWWASSLLCQLTACKDQHNGRWCWRGELKISALLIWDSAKSCRAIHSRVCLCVYNLILPLYFTSFAPPLPPRPPPCLSPCNKAEYLFPPPQRSGLLKGARDRADIRRHVCICMCSGARVRACRLSSLILAPRCLPVSSPSQMYSCVFLRANTPRLKVADLEPRGLVEERPLAGADWAVLSRGRKVTVARYYLPAPTDFISIADALRQNSVQPSK